MIKIMIAFLWNAYVEIMQIIPFAQSWVIKNVHDKLGQLSYMPFYCYIYDIQSNLIFC